MVEGSTLYQGAHVFNYSPASIASFSRQADLTRLKESMLSRLKWCDPNLLKAFLVFIDTQNWQKKESEDDMIEMKSANQLGRIFVNEAHLFCTESEFRPFFRQLAKLPFLPVPFVLMTVTAPQWIVQDILANFFGPI